MNISTALKVLPQYILPHHALSQLMSRMTHSENAVLKNGLIRQIVQHYGVDMNDALEQDIHAFKSFNAFFTRELKPGLRPFTDAPNAIACPADGAVSQVGYLHDGHIMQAKGKTFTAVELLGGNIERAAPFQQGAFATIYLSPKDYHRLHMPLTGTLKEMVHIPGRLFSVNTTTSQNVPRLFARNERVCCLFDTPAGPMALILVGAIFVSSIETVWQGVITPPSRTTIRSWSYQDTAPHLSMGDEMGRFNMGSTIIVLFGKDKMRWDSGFCAEKSVKLGEKMGVFL